MKNRMKSRILFLVTCVVVVLLFTSCDLFNTAKPDAGKVSRYSFSTLINNYTSSMEKNVKMSTTPDYTKMEDWELAAFRDEIVKVINTGTGGMVNIIDHDAYIANGEFTCTFSLNPPMDADDIMTLTMTQKQDRNWVVKMVNDYISHGYLFRNSDVSVFCDISKNDYPLLKGVNMPESGYVSLDINDVYNVTGGDFKTTEYNEININTTDPECVEKYSAPYIAHEGYHYDDSDAKGIKRASWKMDDGRRVSVTFTPEGAYDYQPYSIMTIHVEKYKEIKQGFEFTRMYNDAEGDYTRFEKSNGYLYLDAYGIERTNESLESSLIYEYPLNVTSIKFNIRNQKAIFSLLKMNSSDRSSCWYHYSVDKYGDWSFSREEVVPRYVEGRGCTFELFKMKLDAYLNHEISEMPKGLLFAKMDDQELAAFNRDGIIYGWIAYKGKDSVTFVNSSKNISARQIKDGTWKVSNN